MKMTITVATETPGELAYFRIQLLQSVEETLENIGLLVKPTDVVLGEDMGWWKIVD